MRSKISLPEDHSLWDDVKLTILPLKRKNKAASPDIKRSHSTASAIRINPPRQATAHLSARPVGHSPPPLAAMDRRTAQRLSRGQIEPEARLDLHGEGLEQARIKLLHFLSAQRQLGIRFVLVITGKGASPFARHTLHGTTHFHAPEREGRLRREVPLWLHEENFRLHVVGFQPSHPRHGGGGAFYVRLRRMHGQVA